MAIIKIRRSMDSWMIAKTDDGNLARLQWTDVQGGNRMPMSSYCISGVVPQEAIDGDVAHSGSHREEWKNHQPLRVVVLKKDNDAAAYLELKKEVGPKPGRELISWDRIAAAMQPGEIYSFEAIREFIGKTKVGDNTIRGMLREFIKMDLLTARRQNRKTAYQITEKQADAPPEPCK